MMITSTSQVFDDKPRQIWGSCPQNSAEILFKMLENRAGQCPRTLTPEDRLKVFAEPGDRLALVHAPGQRKTSKTKSSGFASDVDSKKPLVSGRFLIFL